MRKWVATLGDELTPQLTSLFSRFLGCLVGFVDLTQSQSNMHTNSSQPGGGYGFRRQAVTIQQIWVGCLMPLSISVVVSLLQRSCFKDSNWIQLIISPVSQQNTWSGFPYPRCRWRPKRRGCVQSTRKPKRCHGCSSDGWNTLGAGCRGFRIKVLWPQAKQTQIGKKIIMYDVCTSLFRFR